MNHICEPSRRPVPWTAAVFGFLTLEAIVASCAGLDDEAVAARTETDGGAANDAFIDANDATCESDDCPHELARDFEWLPVETSLAPGLGLSSVWGSGPNDVWVVGAAGTVIHWDGSDWTSVPIATTRSLHAVWGTGPNDVWVAGTSIFRKTGSADGTVQWSLPLFSLDEGFVCALWGTSSSDIWVGIGESTYQIGNPPMYIPGLRGITTRDEIAWTPIFQSSRATSIRAIWGSGSEDVWLVGAKGPKYELLSFAAHTKTVAAADAGVPVWTEVDTQSASVLYAVWGSGPNDVWTVGDYGTIRHFAADIDAWSIVDSPTTEHLRSLWGTGTNDVWAVGEHGTFLHYDGTTWRLSTAAFPPGVKPNLYSVWGSGPSDVWAVGGGLVMHFSGPKSGVQGVTP